MAEQDNTNTPWIERASSVKLLARILFALSATVFVPDVLDLLDIGYHKHVHYGVEGWLGFYAIFGFLAYSFIVGAGWIWRSVVMRDESYYGSFEDEGDDA
jgi:hypothetical protein|tara:strand:- start:650 stop:949 length:300 start_codon:yes stop_codon:yes gene_type:complete